MDVPSPAAGKVKEILVSVNDKVSEGTPICSSWRRREAREDARRGRGDAPRSRQRPVLRLTGAGTPGRREAEDRAAPMASASW